MSLNDIENFRRFNVLVQTHFPPDLAAWWLAGVDKFTRGESKKLCSALGLRQAGIGKIKNLDLMKRRNILLKFAVKNCASYPGESMNSRCKTLASLIKRYPRSKSENPLLVTIFNLGIDVPTSPHRLLEIICEFDEYPGYSSNKRRG